MDTYTKIGFERISYHFPGDWFNFGYMEEELKIYGGFVHQAL